MPSPVYLPTPFDREPPDPEALGGEPVPDTCPDVVEAEARSLYEAYRAAKPYAVPPAGESRGVLLPSWEDNPREDVREAWRSTAADVLARHVGPKRRAGGPDDPPVPEIIRQQALARLRNLLEDQIADAKVAASQNDADKPGAGAVWSEYVAQCSDVLATLPPVDGAPWEPLVKP